MGSCEGKASRNGGCEKGFPVANAQLLSEYRMVKKDVHIPEQEGTIRTFSTSLAPRHSRIASVVVMVMGVVVLLAFVSGLWRGPFSERWSAFIAGCLVTCGAVEGLTVLLHRKGR